MKRLKFALALACLLVLAIALSPTVTTAELEAPKGGTATFFEPKDPFAPDTSSILCLIECSDGEREWEIVETRGECLDACERECEELCELQD